MMVQQNCIKQKLLMYILKPLLEYNDLESRLLGKLQTMTCLSGIVDAQFLELGSVCWHNSIRILGAQAEGWLHKQMP